MRRHLASLALLFASAAGLAPVAARAQLPEYSTFELQARAAFTGAFNLPDSAFFTNASPRLNASGQVSFDLEVLPGGTSQGVWSGGGGAGAIVYTSPADTFVLSVGMNDAGVVVWDLAFGSQNGIYRYDPASPPAAFLTNLPLGATSWGSPAVNSVGQVGYRAGFSSVGQAWVSFDGTSTVPIHAAEVGLVAGSPYSFLFTPAFNDARRIAGKVRLGGPGQVGETQPDQIRVFAADGSSVLIAEDVESNAASPYTRFDNAVALTQDGRVAFIATLAAGGRGVFLSDGTTTVTIATEAGPDVSDIEFFAPAANDDGLVAFRAKDENGLRAVWVGDGTALRAVAREHDLIPTDLGPARIDQNDASPVFGGSPAVNAQGDVAFSAALTPPDNDQVEWGTGLFVAYAAPAGIFADGFETGDTSAWASTVP